jgi:hypothetical protein
MKWPTGIERMGAADRKVLHAALKIRAFEETLRQAAPRSADPYAWAQYNQWASEQRTRNQKEPKQ